MSIYDIKVNNRKGEEVSLSDYKDKVLLIINTATRCGNTKQYTALEELYEKYHDKGFEILDFPCNQFGGQAPGTEEEIHEFCVLKYKTTFDQFQKIKVNGANASPLFVFLKDKIQQDEDIGPQNKRMKKTPKNPSDIRWNFTKFLVDKEGNVVGRYPPKCTPDLFEDKIRELLNVTDNTETKTETTAKKSTESPKKTAKAAKETKATKETKAAKETKATKETKAAKETKATKETKAAKETKATKETKAAKETKATKETKASEDTKPTIDTKPVKETKSKKETPTSTTPRRTSARIANRLAKEANKAEEKTDNTTTTKTTKRKRAN